MTSRRSLFALAVTALVVGPASTAAFSQAGTLSPERVPWREISFYGSKFGISLHADLVLERIPAASAFKELLPSHRGAGIAPPDEGALALSLGSEFLSRRSDIRLLLDPQTGAALQRVQTESGRKQRVKSLRYGEQGISTVRTRPAEGEKGLPATQWTDVRKGGDNYPQLPEAGLRVSDPAALLYVIAASSLERPGDAVEVPIFSDERLIVVEARALDLRRVEVDYERGDGAATRRVQGPTTALRLALDARVLGGGAPADFELAGLRGDVEMLLDPATRIPLEVSGRVRYAGTVAIRLRRVVAEAEAAADQGAAPRSEPGRLVALAGNLATTGSRSATSARGRGSH